MDNRGISALQVILILAVLVTLPVLFFLGQIGIGLVLVGIVVVLLLAWFFARAKTPTD